MKYLKYILAAAIILLSTPVYATQDGQLIVREYYRDRDAQPYIVGYDIQHNMSLKRTISSCRRTMESIMSAYNVYYGSDLVHYDFFETKYMCLDDSGNLADAGYYYIIPTHTDLETSCKVTWEQKFSRFYLEDECHSSTNFKIKRFEKALIKNYMAITE